MQKLLSFFVSILLFSSCLFAQSTFPLASFSGQVTDAATGLPIANYPVTIFANYSTLNWYYSTTLYTDINGYYADSTQPDTSNVLMYVYTQDCNGNIVYDSLVYNNGLQNSVINFNICVGSQSILPNFSYVQTQGYNVQFSNLSTSFNALQYYWDLGDGNTSTLANPTANYAAPGAYYVVLTASDNNSSVQYAKTVFVEGTMGNCQADFSTVVDIYGVATFTNTSVNINPNTWAAVDFGNGSGNWYLAYPTSYAYPDSGSYRVCLSVQDSLCLSTFCDSITTTGASNGTSCNSSFVAAQQVGSFIQFYGQTTATNPIVSWDFGDGSTIIQGGINDLNTAHIFPSTGIYSVCLTVINPTSGCQSSYCDDVFVNYATGNVQANFTHTVASNGMVYFTDNSTPNGVLNYYWDFGNGTTSNAYSPSVAYTDTGWYNVCLVVTDIYNPGTANTFCDSVYVPNVQVQTGCQASFTFITNPDSSVTFSSTSYGQNLSTQWSIYNNFNAINLSGSTVTAILPPGLYQVDMSVYGNVCSDFTSQSVSIGGQYVPCNASFTYTIQPSGLVQFVNTSTSSIGIPGGNYFYWDLGNGFTTSTTDANMVYTNVGTYNVTLMQFDLFSGCQSGYTQTIYIASVGGNTGNCQANFSTNIDSTGVITFTDLSTPSGISYNYYWNFGDGTFSSMANNQHLYNVAGTYNVCLSIFDNVTGCSNIYCDSISAPGYSPASCDADFSYFADSLGNFTFFPPASNSPFPLTDYVWAFDNGMYDYTQSPVINFNDSLPHLVCLSIYDLQTGCNASYCDTVIPFSGYNARFIYQTQGNMAMFENKSTGSANLTYQWNLGSGQISAQKDPIAVYPTSGWQNVCLTIWENGMMKGIYCDSVFVNAVTTNVNDNVSLENSIAAPYPNPTSDNINIDISPTKMENMNWGIYDIMGKELKKGTEKAHSSEYTLSISVKDLAKGYYFLSLEMGNETVMRKFVVE